MKKERKLTKFQSKLLEHIGMLLMLVLFFGSLQWIFGAACPMYLVTHICCPFCGMTRAHLAALRLDLETAFYYHPLFPLGLPYLFLCIHDLRCFGLKGKQWRILRTVLIIVISVLLCAVYIYRVIVHGDFDLFR